jgi:FkbM family methyltransferase
MSKVTCKGSVCSVSGRWGTVHFIGKDVYVGRSLASYGEYNPDETEMVISLAVPGKLCLDIGANFGVIGQALEANGFDVEYFEPQPDIVQHVLSKNVRGQIHNKALGAEAGSATMPKILFGSRANYGGMGVGARSELGTIDVELATLDSFAYQNVGLMKIDVEGFEENVLRGAHETIMRCRPTMYIEDDRPEKSAKLRAYIASLGYSIEEHNPPLYRASNYFGLARNIWDANYVSHNLICRPS